MISLIHTSDWHLGRSLYGRKRDNEHRKFLSWLLNIIELHQVDTLCVSGDIFDSTTPSNSSQEMYYSFLDKVTTGCCSHVIITAGNHDSPTLLNAPRELLKSRNISVIGHSSPDGDDEIILIRNNHKELKLIICGVPYLRDREIRIVREAESVDEKGQNLRKGIEKHYTKIITKAQKIIESQGSKTPLVVMGHLFTAGGLVSDGDGVRELYIGDLTRVPASIFPPTIDYLALGHLHRSQMVASYDQFRYCGSPLPMSFKEAKSQKTINLIRFSTHLESIESINVPIFQELQTISGDLESILQTMKEQQEQNKSIWLEILYKGQQSSEIVQKTIHDAAKPTLLEVLRISHDTFSHNFSKQVQTPENLKDLSTDDVFKRCLEQYEYTNETNKELLSRFRQIENEVLEEDVNN